MKVAYRTITPPMSSFRSMFYAYHHATIHHHIKIVLSLFSALFVLKNENRFTNKKWYPKISSNSDFAYAREIIKNPVTLNPTIQLRNTMIN